MSCLTAEAKCQFALSKIVLQHAVNAPVASEKAKIWVARERRDGATCCGSLDGGIGGGTMGLRGGCPGSWTMVCGRAVQGRNQISSRSLRRDHLDLGPLTPRDSALYCLLLLDSALCAVLRRPAIRLPRQAGSPSGRLRRFRQFSRPACALRADLAELYAAAKQPVRDPRRFSAGAPKLSHRGPELRSPFFTIIDPIALCCCRAFPSALVVMLPK